MKNILLIILFYSASIFSQDTIFRYEEKPIKGNIVYVDTNLILYQKGNYIEDIPINFVYGYKRDGIKTILYQEKNEPITLKEMDDYVMGKALGFKQHVSGIPFTIGFFSSFFYTYYNTRGLTRNPKFSSLAFMAVPPIIFTIVKPKTSKKWSREKRIGYQIARSERNQISSFGGSLLGTAFIYSIYFSSN